jgi:ketosteroid isomerase-like protein
MLIETILVELTMALAAASAPDALVAEVICAETGFSRTAERKDLPAFLEYVDPDARFGSLKMARGREAIAADWANVFDADGPDMRWRPQIVEVSADGSLALSRGPFRSVAIADDGTTQETWGHFISTWRRNSDGKWQVLFDSGADFGMQPSNDEMEILAADPECSSPK